MEALKLCSDPESDVPYLTSIQLSHPIMTEIVLLEIVLEKKIANVFITI